MAPTHFVLVLSVLAVVAASSLEGPSSLRVQSREKRQIGGPGRQEWRDPTDPEYKQLAKESYDKYLLMHPSTAASLAPKDIIVTKATYQVVAGSMKRIDFTVYTIYDNVLTCHSEVFEQAWLHRKDIDVKCSF